ncbi:hypothetical protein Ddc_19601 [Ditylenchus destructor]|nr:hypothetical protein Ddc_19601 [Ditylenchus destructor]
MSLKDSNIVFLYKSEEMHMTYFAAVVQGHRRNQCLLRNISVPIKITKHLKEYPQDKCTILCENGGIVTPQCTCKCAYGFTGKNCEKLGHSNLYTDASCGVVDIDTGYSQSTVSLRQPAGKDTFCQWIIKSTDPWTTCELEFEDLDLDSENLAPGQKCGDQLSVFEKLFWFEKLRQPVSFAGILYLICVNINQWR